MSDIDRLIAEVEQGPQGPQIGAFFDFDGTLIDGYSALVYFRDRLRSGDMQPRELVDTLVEAFNVQRRGQGVSGMVRVAAEGLAGRSQADMDQLADRLFREKIAGMVYPDARVLVETHRAMGHTIAIASSATRFQTSVAAKDLGIDNILVTELDADGGVLTGLVSGPVLWGEGKARAVREFAAAQGVDLAQSYAYGNGHEDVPYLATVGRPRPLNPDSGLAAVAAERGWPVAHLGEVRRVGPVEVARSLAAYTALGAGVLTGAGMALLNRDRQLGANVAATVGADVALAAGGVRLDVQGEEHLWSHRPAVFLFNHQSQLDVLILSALLRRNFTGVAKKSLAHDPVFAPIGYLADVAYVDRSNTEAAKAALAPVVDSIRKGMSIAVAPEGTRSPTPRLLPFKKGAFHMAMQARVPLVPIVIRNAGEILRPRAKILSPGTVQVCVLPPVSTRRWKVADLDRHITEVRGAYLETLANWPPAAPAPSA